MKGTQQMKHLTKILLCHYSIACIQVQFVLFSNQAVADVTSMPVA